MKRISLWQRKAPKFLKRDEFEVETPLLRKFLGRKADEEVAQLRTKRRRVPDATS